jgi:hypothetical protein
MQTYIKNKSVFVITLIVIAAMARLVPHPPNFSPIGAMALMGGAYLSRKWLAILVPILALYLSDIILNNFVLSEFFGESMSSRFFSAYMLPVYGSIILIAFIGMKFLKRIKLPSVLLSALGASVVFYLVTNFGVWLAGSGYPKTIGGLISCFTAGLPFFKYTILGNVVFAGILFGIVEIVSKRYFIPQLDH